MTRISVAMTTCNGAKYIAEQLLSISAQTHLPDELVICDDRSDDQTLETIETVLADVPFTVEVVSNPERLGVVANVEQAIRRTNGDIIVLADQDDVWRPHKLARLAEHFATRPQTSAVFSDAEITDQRSQPTGKRLWSSVGFAGRRRNRWAIDPVGVLLQGNVVTGATLAFRASLKGAILPIDRSGWHDLWIAILAAAMGRIDALDVALLDYRVHDHNAAGLARSIRVERCRRLARPEERVEALQQMNALVSRLEELGSGAAPAAARLREKARHLQFRTVLPQRKLSRGAAVMYAAGAGRYRRYSAGFHSVAFDLAYGGRTRSPVRRG